MEKTLKKWQWFAVVAQAPYTEKPGPLHRRSCAGESIAVGRERCAHEEWDFRSGFGAQPQGFGAYSVAPGCQLLCLLVLVPEFFSLPLSYFSAFLFSDSFTVAWPGLELQLRPQGQGAESTAVETGGGSTWWRRDSVMGERVGKRKSWRKERMKSRSETS